MITHNDENEILGLKKQTPKMTREERAALLIQSHVRGHLARRDFEIKHKNNFKKHPSDPKKDLILMEKGIVKICGMYFIIYFYTDSERKHI